MAKTVSMIGIQPDELVWVRTMLSLLRHPDPVTKQMAQQAMRYLADGAAQHAEPYAAVNQAV